MCGVLVTFIIWCDCARCDGNQGKLQPKREFSSGPCDRAAGEGCVFSLPQRRHGLQQIGASTAWEILLLRMFFPINFKRRNGHRCRDKENPSYLISLLSLTEISDASACHALLSKLSAILLKKQIVKSMWLEWYKAGQPNISFLLPMVLENFLK